MRPLASSKKNPGPCSVRCGASGTSSMPLKKRVSAWAGAAQSAAARKTARLMCATILRLVLSREGELSFAARMTERAGSALAPRAPEGRAAAVDGALYRAAAIGGHAG